MQHMRKASTILVTAGLLAAILPLPAGAIEAWYSARFYPILQRVLTRFSNVAPFALLDAAVVLILVALLALARRDWRSSGPRAALVRAIAPVLAVAAASSLAFLVCWGLNYRRVPLDARLPFDADRVTEASLRRLTDAAIGGLNQLHDAAHAEGWTESGVVDQALARDVD